MGREASGEMGSSGTPDDPSLPTVVCGHGVHVRGDIWPCRSLQQKPQRERDVWSTEWRGGGGAVRLSDGSDAGSPHGAVEMEQQAHMELFAGKNRGCRERKRERRAIIKVAHPRCLLRLLPRSARRDTWRARDREDANVRFPRRIHSIFHKGKGEGVDRDAWVGGKIPPTNKDETAGGNFRLGYPWHLRFVFVGGRARYPRRFWA
jgi:hypothetical protein